MIEIESPFPGKSVFIMESDALVAARIPIFSSGPE